MYKIEGYLLKWEDLLIIQTPVTVLITAVTKLVHVFLALCLFRQSWNSVDFKVRRLYIGR